MPRAKSLSDMSDADLVAQRDALNAEIERRRSDAVKRLNLLGGEGACSRGPHEPDGDGPQPSPATTPRPVFLNPRKTTPIEAPDDGRSSPAQIASNLPGPPAQEASSPGRLESARFDNDDLEVPPALRRV